MAGGVGVVKRIVAHQREDGRVIEVAHARETQGVDEKVQRQLPDIANRDARLQKNKKKMEALQKKVGRGGSSYQKDLVVLK